MSMITRHVKIETFQVGGGERARWEVAFVQGGSNSVQIPHVLLEIVLPSCRVRAVGEATRDVRAHEKLHPSAQYPVFDGEVVLQRTRSSL